MRDRLIELLTTEVECNKDGHSECEMCEYKFTDKECERHISEIIADFMLEKGVIVPPCKVGDKIYMVVTRRTTSYEFPKGCGMVRKENQHTFIKQTYLTKLNFFRVLEDFGKTVFLTREEAERALKGGDSDA